MSVKDFFYGPGGRPPTVPVDPDARRGYRRANVSLLIVCLIVAGVLLIAHASGRFVGPFLVVAVASAVRLLRLHRHPVNRQP